ncbi:hypothetical protein PFLA_b0712 [Pseudoalteromonas flavipulchra NCIMB 2033 = ATCC BAA-314]|nr:hypothetical protein [Pseudoalteromonas flavipulchra NCIMB 2033 = ATCC BAA-314]
MFDTYLLRNQPIDLSNGFRFSVEVQVARAIIVQNTARCIITILRFD